MTERHYGHEPYQKGVMELDFWLTIARGGTMHRRPSVKVSASYPNLARNERAMRLKMSLPLALFETPALSASITVEEPTQAIQIDATAIAEAVQTCIGMDVDVQVVVPESVE